MTTLASGFDGAVRRMSTTYTSLGQVQLVTQYDNATVGSGTVVDEVKYTYDGWGNLTLFEQDRDSAVAGGGNDYEVGYTYEKATGGCNTLRRTSVTLPGSAILSYVYDDTGGLLDEAASRVTRIEDAYETALVIYDYNGAGQVVGTYMDEPEVKWKLSGSSGTYPDLDRFDRVVSSRWTADESTDRDFYSVSLAYDRNSNITSQDDLVHTGHDAAYTNDSLNRLTRAQEGTWGGSSITTQFRDQQWTLNQTGNWEVDKVNLNGDGDFTDTGELNDDRTHNAVNELNARDTDDNGTDNFTLTYDAAGNLTDDGEAYKFEWDAFYRLRKVRNQSNALVSEYWYNGLGYLLTRHQDTDRDGDVDASDKKYHSAFDERWRVVGTYRAADANPKERFLYHCAGNGGFGGSSYIDLCVFRDRDANTGWTQASDGTLEDRVYYCQNWRADVVAVVASSGGMLEWAKYSAYGIPFGLPGGDTDSDGDCDATDVSQVQTWINAASYDSRGDVDLDGDVDATDKSTIESDYEGLTAGRGTLTNIDVRKGYAGYEFDSFVGQKYHVRHRVLDSVLGRWLRRDPLGRLIKSLNHVEYAASKPITHTDFAGLAELPRPRVGPPRREYCTNNNGSVSGRCSIECTYQYQPPTNGPSTPVGPQQIPVVGFIITHQKTRVHDCSCPESGLQFCSYIDHELMEMAPVVAGTPSNSTDLQDRVGVGGTSYGYGRAELRARFYTTDAIIAGGGFDKDYWQAGDAHHGPFVHYLRPGESKPGYWTNPNAQYDTFKTIIAWAMWECCPIGPPACFSGCSQ